MAQLSQILKDYYGDPIKRQRLFLSEETQDGNPFLKGAPLANTPQKKKAATKAVAKPQPKFTLEQAVAIAARWGISFDKTPEKV